LIDEILKKAVNNKKISDDEFLQLLKINKEEDLKKLCETAVSIRNQQSTLQINVQSNQDVNIADLHPKPQLKDIMNLFIKQMKKYLKLQYPLKKRGSLE